MSPLLTAQNLTKRFGGVLALDGVSFALQPGEIHALCGENGAGKSTLIKLLSGLHSHGSYDGELYVGGEPARFRSIADAEQAGIAVIYQELALVDGMTVAENIFLGREPRRWGRIQWARMFQEARALLEQFGVAIDPTARCGDLGVGQKQLVEIVKALGKRSRVLILDEPTAALAEHEVQVLLTILRQLRAQGIACIYISHRLEEVFALADRLTVLRDGRTVFSAPAGETNRTELIRHMVGREIQQLFPRRASESLADAAPALEVRGLSVRDAATRRPVLHELSFQLAPGEVLGLGGLMGAGRTELLMHLFGVWGERTAGEVRCGGRVLAPGSPQRALRAGLALVSEDRRRYGLLLEQSIDRNLTLSSLPAVSRGGFISAGEEHRASSSMAASLRVKAANLDTPVGALSGGNQQKVVLGKALLTGPSVVLLDEPTRGIDVGAKQEIYELINELTAAGKAVLLVSSELPELMGMSDRILMFHAGRLGGSFTRAEATPEALLAAAMGQSPAVENPPPHV